MTDEQQGTQQGGGSGKQDDEFQENPQRGGTSEGTASDEGIGPDDGDTIVNAGEG